MRIYRFKSIILSSTLCFSLIGITALATNSSEIKIPDVSMENIFTYPEEMENSISELQYKLSEYDSTEYLEIKSDLDSAVSKVAEDMQAQYELELAQEEANRKKEDYQKQIEQMQEQLLEQQAQRAKAAEEEELEQYNNRQSLFGNSSSSTTITTDSELDGVTGSRDGPITIITGRNPYAIKPAEGTVYKQIS